MYVFLVSFISEYLIFLLFSGVLYPCFKKDWPMVIKIFLALTITAVIRRLANAVWYEPRPFVINPSLLLYATSIKADASSFFSGHASTAFALAGAIFLRYKRLGLLLLTGATAVAIGRVLSVLHYPLDVIVGGAVGFGVSYGVEMTYPHIIKKLNKTRRVLQKLKMRVDI